MNHSISILELINQSANYAKLILLTLRNIIKWQIFFWPIYMKFQHLMPYYKTDIKKEKLYLTIILYSASKRNWLILLAVAVKQIFVIKMINVFRRSIRN